MHAGLSVGPKSSPAKLNWGVDGRDGGNVIIYVQTDSDADLGIKLPAGIDAKQNLSSYVHPLTNQVVIELRVPSGLNGLELYSKSDATYVADAYIYGEWAAFAGINYNRVSDDNYFVDFSESIIGSSNTVLPQDAFIAYNQPYWNSAVRVTKNRPCRLRWRRSRRPTSGCRRRC